MHCLKATFYWYYPNGWTKPILFIFLTNIEIYRFWAIDMYRNLPFYLDRKTHSFHFQNQYWNINFCLFSICILRYWYHIFPSYSNNCIENKKGTRRRSNVFVEKIIILNILNYCLYNSLRVLSKSFQVFLSKGQLKFNLTLMAKWLNLFTCQTIRCMKK